jgi:hypothetical protein
VNRILGTKQQQSQGTMTRCTLATAWLLVLASLPATSHAADPKFTIALVTESRQYEREKAAPSFGGIRLPGPTEWTSRVTVALDGERITGEWVPKTTISVSAEDFPRGSDVPAAATRNQLLLKYTDGSVVTAKIVRRVKPEEDEDKPD